MSPTRRKKLFSQAYSLMTYIVKKTSKSSKAQAMRHSVIKQTETELRLTKSGRRFSDFINVLWYLKYFRCTSKSSVTETNKQDCILQDSRQPSPLSAAYLDAVEQLVHDLNACILLLHLPNLNRENGTHGKLTQHTRHNSQPGTSPKPLDGKASHIVAGRRILT